MSARASIRKADLNRAVEVAKAHGYVVEVRGEVIRLLPIDPDAPLPSPDLTDSDWSKALGSWRGSA